MGRAVPPVAIPGSGVDDAALAEKRWKVSELRANTTSRFVTFHFEELGNELVKELAEGLTGHPKLGSLQLPGNCIGDEVVSSLADVLKWNRKLKELDLSANRISDDGAARLGAALTGRAPAQLEILCLQSNHIGDAGVARLTEATVGRGFLTSLDLSVNFIGDQGATELAAVLERRDNRLRVLNLRGNAIQDTGGCRLAMSLDKNTMLRSLDLSFNRIEDQGGQLFAKTLERNSILVSVNLEGNDIGQRASNRLVSATLARKRSHLNLDKELSRGQRLRPSMPKRANTVGLRHGLRMASASSLSQQIQQLHEKAMLQESLMASTPSVVAATIAVVNERHNRSPSSRRSFSTSALRLG
eukprot:TRINITY_DN76381_c0_g1_i1.p1 TRINITY_DN76381_c0_g1~~TRINITY_DN76381_c0_g1_i1.p1  ORF type:complete len:357 (+),score=62.59 TRINITY_DN76381_c0_g1_i1:92-1162(+)